VICHQPISLHRDPCLYVDTGEEKKQLCLRLGAEKWVDFRESADLIQEIQAATDGLGPHVAIIAAGDVGLVFLRIPLLIQCLTYRT